MTSAPFPWTSHRSWAEVRETERMRKQAASGEPRCDSWWFRLKYLEKKARPPVYDSTPEPRRMSRPGKPSENHTADVMRLGREGISWSAISERCCGTVDRCLWVWRGNATADDERARHLAKVGARIITNRVLKPVENALRTPERGPIARNAFTNNVDPIEYGKAVPVDDTRRSGVGCAALMVCS